MPNIRKISEMKKLLGPTAKFTREHRTNDEQQFDTYQTILINQLQMPVSIWNDTY